MKVRQSQSTAMLSTSPACLFFFKLPETSVHEIKNHLVKTLFVDLWLEGDTKEVA